MQHRALLENQIKDKAFKRAAAEFNKAQERMTAERSEAAYQMMPAHSALTSPSKGATMRLVTQSPWPALTHPTHPVGRE